MRTPRGSRRRLARRWVGSVLLSVLVGLAVIAGVAVASGRYQVRPVLSGSMRPGLPVGGVVITHRMPLSEIKVRDVVVFTRPNDSSELVVHRVIKLTRNGSNVTVKTQGDANNAPDPWTLNMHGSTAYRAVYSLPLLGYPAVWLQHPGIKRLLLIGAGLLIVIVAPMTFRKDRRESTDADPVPDAERADDHEDVTPDSEAVDRAPLVSVER